MTNPTLTKTMKIATIAGASIIAVGAVKSLFGVKSVGAAVMPALTILVAISAFNYAVKSHDLVVAEPKK